jgi:hypothetical protein
MELCPSCGEFKRELNEVTGFCEGCTDDGRKSLTVEAYLAANADEIEHYLLQGKSVAQAIDLLHGRNGRPICVSCGAVITRGRRTSIFCRKNPDCRRYSRRYVYLYTERGMTKAEALAVVLAELT